MAISTFADRGTQFEIEVVRAVMIGTWLHALCQTCRGLQRKAAAWRPFPLRLPKLAASSFQTKRAVAYWPLSTFAAAIGERLEAKRTWLKCARYGA